MLEGVNVLQRGSGRVYVSDFLDFALYLDAEEDDVRRWYLSRFLALRNGAFQNPDSYFHRYAQLSDAEAVAVATGIWERTNRPNLRNNIQPTRPRADVILEKGPDHFVSRVLLRRPPRRRARLSQPREGVAWGGVSSAPAEVELPSTDDDVPPTGPGS